MKTAFNISSQDASPVSNLFIELSDDGFSYVASNKNNVNALKILRFTDSSNYSENAHAIARLIAAEDILKTADATILISCSFPENILTPAEFYNHNETAELFKTLHGDSFARQSLRDNLTAQGIINDYSIPLDYNNILKEHYPAAQVKHQYSLLIDKLDKLGDRLHVLFYFDKIVVVLFNTNHLQMVQTFPYKVPADVVYHMLNVSQQFHIKESHVTVYGLIEKSSTLYEEIHKYFMNISFAELPAGVQLGKQFADYPDHLFAHLFYTSL